ncbi:MAG: tetratricopeptide repeat protein [Pseudomonadota bacterium]
MRQFLIIALVVVVLVPWGAARGDMVEVCNQGDDPDLRLAGCTAIIQSGQWSEDDLAIAFNNRGTAYADLGQHSRAIEDYDEALRLDPNYTEANYNRGDAYAELGQHARAIQDYDAALRLDPNDAKALNNRGNAYAYLGQHSRAIQDYDEALRLHPSAAMAFYNRGNAYADLGQHSRAIQDFDEVLRLDPSAASAYHNRGISQVYVGNFDQAMRDWERAMELTGAPRVMRWQEHLKSKGLYAGAIDGIYRPEVRRALEACAKDPAC